MPRSLSAVFLHAVFSTKGREPFLRDPVLRREMHAYLGGISKSLDCPPVAIGGVANHGHILARVGRGVGQSDWIKELKRVSSGRIKRRDATLRSFAWQAGFGVFSISASNVARVEQYIAMQEEHHRKVTFQDEFRALLRRHELEWDER